MRRSTATRHLRAQPPALVHTTILRPKSTGAQPQVNSQRSTGQQQEVCQQEACLGPGQASCWQTSCC
eukprot:11192945-Lingulodinium_polyedra.AAC.1